MLLLVLQVASALLTLAFGAMAVRVMRLAGRNRDRALAAWEPTAFAFLLAGTLLLAQALWAAAAIRAGAGSGTLDTYLAWAQPLNVGRGALTVAYAAVLAALVVGGRRWALRLSARSLPVFGTAATVGTLAGRLLDDRTPNGQMAQLGVLGAVTVLVLLGVLLAAVTNDGLDQLLWFALAAYTLKETMQVSLFALIAWWTPGSSRAVTYGFYALALLVLVIMAVLGARRVRMAAARQHVPALFEHIHARRSPAT
ncbi:MAG TPA: hypothetical protein VFQ45_22410 [Longimicrobium sp.]|nr:hypothetical protein [Longimicrobium sp.]